MRDEARNKLRESLRGTVIERAANAHARVPATPRGTGTAIGAALHHSLTEMPQGERK